MWKAILVAMLAMAGSIAVAQSQDAAFPKQGVTLVVPYPAGGSVDTVARILAQKLQSHWARTIIVENKPGAGGSTGANIVARAKGDGHTLLITPAAILATSDKLFKSLPFDPMAFKPVVPIGKLPNVAAVRASLPVESLANLVALAKRDGSDLTFASAGFGTSLHLTGELFYAASGARLRHIPYSGDRQALQDLVAQRVDVMFVNISSALPLHRAGNIKILAVLDSERSPVAPDIPTSDEAALANFHSVPWYALLAPPDTPDGHIAIVNKALNDVIGAPDVKQRLFDLGIQPLGGSAQDATKLLQADRDLWVKVIEQAGIVPQ